ncbi:MAG: DUF2460 domain-containing protein [Pseudomonadota bacterium]
MAFHEVLFPITLALGARGGPQWRTDVLPLASGAEIRNAPWSRGRRRWDVGSAVTDLTGLQTLVAFFEARSGPLNGFRFRDPLDHKSCGADEVPNFDDQALGVGDSATVEYQLAKISDGVGRKIHKPVAESVRVGMDGVLLDQGWAVDHSTGRVVFDSPPAAGAVLTAGFYFDVPARFENDQINAVIEAYGAGRIASLGLVELWIDAS